MAGPVERVEVATGAEVAAGGGRLGWLLLGGVGGLAVVLRLPGSWGQSLWEDEVAAARVMHEPTIVAALARVVKTESTPPLWYLLVWSLHHIGLPIIDGRLVSVAAGGALAVLVVVLARQVLSFPLAIAAGVLVASGSEFVDHGHELRSYELLAAVTVLFALCLLELVARSSRRWAAAVAAVVAVGGLTHFFFAFSVLAAAVWVAFDPAVRRVRGRVLGAMAVGSVLPLAWLPLMLAQYHSGRFWWIGGFRWRYVLAVPLRLFSYAFSSPRVGPALSIAMLVLVAAGVVRLGRRGATGRLIVALALGPLCAAAAVWAAGMPIFDLRNLIGTGAFVAVSVSAAVDGLPRPARAVGGLVLVGAVAASLLFFPPAPNPPFAQIARTLLRDGWNGTQAISVVGDPAYYRLPLEWYLPSQPTLRVAGPSTVRCRTTFVLRPNTGVVTIAPARARRRPGESLLIEQYTALGCERLPRSPDRTLRITVRALQTRPTRAD